MNWNKNGLLFVDLKMESFEKNTRSCRFGILHETDFLQQRDMLLAITHGLQQLSEAQCRLQTETPFHERLLSLMLSAPGVMR